jgi:hypothetical protein
MKLFSLTIGVTDIKFRKEPFSSFKDKYAYRQTEIISLRVDFVHAVFARSQVVTAIVCDVT